VPTPAPFVRLCTAADWPVVRRVDELAFSYTWDPASTTLPDEDQVEIERTHLAFVDDVPVGIASAYTLRVSTPGGGELPMAGVTWVGVLPTHRRRGVLSALMQEQLADVHRRGEPLAGLFASEPGIYGRFGYGQAVPQVFATVRRGSTELRAPDPVGLHVRIVAAGEAQVEAAVGQVYDCVRQQRPGMAARPHDWWVACVDDPPSQRAGASELRALLVGDGERTRGYALFTAKEDWENGSAEGTVTVREALAADPAAGGLLWSTLLSTDLIGSFEVRRMAPDDLLLNQLVDARRARPELRDGMYLRLVDLPAALSARSYAAPWSGVVQVSDAWCPWNAGRWRLSLGPDDASAQRTDDEPDIELDVAELGGAYLGGVGLAARMAAGFVHERTSGAVGGLSTALRHELAPVCPFGF
jgi:predicted acetyltransferase